MPHQGEHRRHGFFAAADRSRAHGYRALEARTGHRPGRSSSRDINPGRESSRAGSLTAAGGRLFFGASDGVHGYRAVEG